MMSKDCWLVWLLATVSISACADKDAFVRATLPGGIYEGTELWIGKEKVGEVTHIERSGDGKIRTGRLSLPRAVLHGLDAATLWIARPEKAGGDRQAIVATNLCVQGKPSGLAVNSEVKLLHGSMRRLLNTMNRDHGPCMKRLGGVAFARFRKAVQAPLGEDPLVQKAYALANEEVVAAAAAATQTGH